MLKRRSQAGDTLIEVLFAVTVFSLIVVSSLSLMNQGSVAAQRSLEITLVRQQIDNQAETLRYLHESYVTNYRTGYSSDPNLTLTGPTGEFYKIIQTVNATGAKSASAFGAGATCQTPPSGSFILDPYTANLITPAKKANLFQPANTFAQLTYTSGVLTSSNGIWIEAIRSGTSSDPNQASGYIDFHIRACWDGPGSDIPMNLGTIVRLYEPRG